MNIHELFKDYEKDLKECEVQDRKFWDSFFEKIKELEKRVEDVSKILKENK